MPRSEGSVLPTGMLTAAGMASALDGGKVGRRVSGAGFEGNSGLGCREADAGGRAEITEATGRAPPGDGGEVSGVVVPATAWVCGAADSRRTGRLERNSKRIDPRQIAMTGIT